MHLYSKYCQQSGEQTLVMCSCYSIKVNLHLLSHPTRLAIHQNSRRYWSMWVLRPVNFKTTDWFRLAVKIWNYIEKIVYYFLQSNFTDRNKLNTLSFIWYLHGKIKKLKSVHCKHYLLSFYSHQLLVKKISTIIRRFSIHLTSNSQSCEVICLLFFLRQMYIFLIIWYENAYNALRHVDRMLVLCFSPWNSNILLIQLLLIFKSKWNSIYIVCILKTVKVLLPALSKVVHFAYTKLKEIKESSFVPIKECYLT